MRLGDGADLDVPIARKPNGTLYAATEDVDGDGDLDLILHFDVQDLVDAGVLSSGTETVTLTGRTGEGVAVSGSDRVQVIG